MRGAVPLLLGLIVLFPAYAGNQVSYLTTREIRMVVNNRPDYEFAANRTGLPWLALAAIHYEENDFKRYVGSVGGAFALDLGEGPKPSDFEHRIWNHEEKVAKKYFYRRDAEVENDFRFACLVGADELRSKCRGKLWDDDGTVNTEVLYDAMMGYNGRVKGGWKKACYCANDPKRGKKMMTIYRLKDGTRKEYPCERPGAVTIWRELLKLEKEGKL